MKTASLLILLAVGSAMGAPAVAGTTGPGFAKTCQHYEKRIQDSSEAPRYISALADSCAVALAQLAAKPDGPAPAKTPLVTVRARVFLERLTLLRRTVTAININRFISNRTATTAVVAFSPVSKTGEYLIARRLGALAAHRAFEAQANFKLSAK